MAIGAGRGPTSEWPREKSEEWTRDRAATSGHRAADVRPAPALRPVAATGGRCGAAHRARVPEAGDQGTGRAWDEGPPLETPKSWGGVARRGAGAATGRRVLGAQSGASRAWRDAADDARPPRSRTPAAVRRAAAEPADVSAEALDAERRAARESRAAEEWVLVEEVRDEAEGAVARSASRSRQVPEPEPLDLAEEVRAQLVRAVGSARTERVERRLAEAVEHFEAERFADAARILKKLSDEAPTVPAVRELYGLTLYRQEKWKQAARELEAFRLLSGSTEQHPVLADCYRALRQWPQVEELWDELRQDSPDAELVTEGRIVMAGALADRDRVTDALRLLQQGWAFPKRPRLHHLRRAYALADLYERAGEVPKARDLFQRIRSADPDFADVAQRLRNLR